MVATESEMLSPFLAEEELSSKWMTEPPSLCMAATKEQLVRVLGSKNIDARTLPWKKEEYYITSDYKKKIVLF